MANLELKRELEAFNSDTLKLIECLEKEDYNAIDNLLDKRQQAIDNISKLDYTKEEFSNIIGELNMVSNEKKLSELILLKRDGAKEELSKMSNAKNANHVYNRKIYSNARIFNKTI